MKMKQTILISIVLMPLLALADAGSVDWAPVVQFLMSLSPLASNVLKVLGTLTVLGMGIDSLIPDEKDKGFMGKILAIPFLGDFLKELRKFSPFNFKS